MSANPGPTKPVQFSPISDVSLAQVGSNPNVYSTTFGAQPVYYGWPSPVDVIWNKQFQLDLPAGTTWPSNAIVSIFALDNLNNSYPCATANPPQSTTFPNCYTTYTAVSWPCGVTCWPQALTFTLQVEFPVTETPPKTG